MKNILSLLACLFALTINAQTVNISGGVSFAGTGIYDKDAAPFNMNEEGASAYTSETHEYNYDYTNKSKYLIGWNAAANFQWNFREHLALLAGVEASTKGYYSVETYIEEMSSTNSNSHYYVTRERKETYTYLDIPLGLKLDLFATDKFKIYGTGGLFFGFALSGKYTYRNEVDYLDESNGVVQYSAYELVEDSGEINLSGPDESETYPNNEGWRLNTGIFGGIGFQYANFFVQGNYSLGAANLDPQNQLLYLRRNINISAGYAIKL